MESYYFGKSLDYSGAFYEMFGFVMSCAEHSKNSDVKRIFEQFSEIKARLDQKYLSEV